MEKLNYIQIILGFAGGLGLFLYGMNIMGEGLQKAAGNRLKKLLAVLTNNRLLGVLVGAAVAAIIQSSSAATVMVVGFVNAELMTLSQAIGVIMGANVGTTITAWIVSLGEWSKFLQPATLAPIAIIIGVIMLFFSPKERTRQYGGILFGFGSLFLGLDMMGDAVAPLSTLPQFKSAFIQIGSNPILGILTGVVVTAIIQSSSASVGILQTLAAASLVPWNAAVYIIMGQNIGTCVTAMLSAIGASKNGKRAAAIHLLFNVIGSIIFAIIAAIYFVGINVPAGNALITMTQISVVHTVFNMLNIVMLYPFADKIIVLAEKIVSGTEPESEAEFVHLDSRILETPTFAIQNVIEEITRMGELSAYNLNTAVEGLLEQNRDKLEEVYENELVINRLQHGINNYLVKITNTPISEYEHAIITGLFHSVSDIERVGDHADNIAELAETGLDSGLEFTEIASKEIEEIVAAAGRSFQLALEACRSQDMEIAEQVLEAEKLVNEMEKSLRDKYIKRLTEEKCTSIAGITLLDLLSNLERISDHAANIANTILEMHYQK